MVEVIAKNCRGGNITRTLIRVDRNNTKYWLVNNRNCERCGGMGGSHAWDYSGFTCYRCGGTGIDPDPLQEKEYTPEYQAKLDAARKKRWEKKHQEIIESRKKELETRFTEGKIFIVLGNTYNRKDQIKLDGGHFNNIHKWYFDHYVDGYELFPVEIEKAFETDADGIIDLKQPIKIELPKIETEQKSEWVGSVKERISVKVKIINCYEYERKVFNGYGTEAARIYTFEDELGNKFVWYTTSIIGEYVKNERNRLEWKSYGKNDVVEIKGTIKKHGEYNGEKQTELQRVQFVRLVA